MMQKPTKTPLVERLKALKLEWFFLILAILFGNAIAIITPPGETPDEPSHAARAFEVFQGHLLPQQVKETPTSFSMIVRAYQPGVDFSFSALAEKLATPFDAQATTPSGVHRIHYPFLLYLPQVLGMALGALFNLPAYLVWLLARLFNLAAYITLVFFAIRRMPFGKWVIFFIALLPMSLAQAASLSADALINGVGLFCLAALLYEKSVDATPNPKRAYLMFFIFCVLLSLTKIYLLPLSFLFLLLGNLRRLNPKKFWLLFGAGILLQVVIFGLWNSAIVGISAQPDPGINPAEQMRFILLEPMTFLENVLATLKGSVFFYYRSLVGIFGWLDTPLPDILYLFYAAALVLVLLVEPIKALQPSEQLGLGAFFVMGGLLLFVSLYAICSPPAAQTVGGIQGRYFIPLLPLAMLFFATTRQYADKTVKVFKWVALAVMLLGLLATVITLVLRFHTDFGMSLLHFGV